MKVLFLDIDGVLIPFRANKFDPKCLENLKLIHTAVNFEIVLSSTWRMFPGSTDAVNRKLEEYGLPRIFDKTPIFKNSSRGQEICSWLDERSDVVEGWVAVDDIELDHRSSPVYSRMVGHCVLTDPLVGLNKQLADKTIEILKKVSRI